MENKYLTEKQKTLAVYKWTLGKYKAISIAYWIMLFMALPMIELFSMIVVVSNKRAWVEYEETIRDLGPGLTGSIFTLIVIAFSTIVTIILLSYMHNKRAVDLFGSFPISRRNLFIARYFAILTMCIVPVIVMGLVGLALTFDTNTILHLLRMFAILILGIVGNVTFISFISVCCGTVADVLICYAIINGIYPISILVCYFFPTSVIPGLSEGYIETPTIFTLLSPFIAPFAGEWIRESVEMHTIWWILFSIVLFVGCYILYKKRKAETAQNAFAFSIVEIVIKFVSCFIGGFCLGWVLSFLGADSLKANYMWFVAGTIMGIMIINVLLHLIFHRGMDGYKKSLLECAVVSFALFAFVSVIVTGAFGFDKRVPKVEDVKEVCVLVGEDKYNVNGENILEYYNSDKEIIDAAISTHESIVQKYDKKYHGLYSLHSNIIDEETDEKYAGEDIIIKYKLKNGKIMTRFYYYVSGIDNLGVFKSKVNNADLLSKIPVSDLQYIELSKVKDGKSINDYEYYTGDGDFEMSDYEMILAALIKDISEQGVYTKKKYTGYNMVLTFSDMMGGSVDIELNIPESYKNTIEALKETGLANCDYNYLVNNDYGEFASAEEVVEKQTIYFELPKGWNENLEINCLQFNSDWDYKNDDEVELLANINSKIPLCEKVSDRIWKYTIFELKDEDSVRDSYKQIMFCQQDGDTFRTTGIIDLQKDENKNLLKLDKDFNDAKVDDEMNAYFIEHDYHWEEYKQ